MHFISLDGTNFIFAFNKCNKIISLSFLVAGCCPKKLPTVRKNLLPYLRGLQPPQPLARTVVCLLPSMLIRFAEQREWTMLATSLELSL